MQDLKILRDEIDKIDDEILILLNKRMKFVAQIAALKQKYSSPIYHPKREEEILKRLENLDFNKINKEDVKKVFCEIFTISKNKENFNILENDEEKY